MSAFRPTSLSSALIALAVVAILALVVGWLVVQELLPSRSRTRVQLPASTLLLARDPFHHVSTLRDAEGRIRHVVSGHELPVLVAGESVVLGPRQPETWDADRMATFAVDATLGWLSWGFEAASVPFELETRVEFADGTSWVVAVQNDAALLVRCDVRPPEGQGLQQRIERELPALAPGDRPWITVGDEYDVTDRDVVLTVAGERIHEWPDGQAFRRLAATRVVSGWVRCTRAQIFVDEFGNSDAWGLTFDADGLARSIGRWASNQDDPAEFLANTSPTRRDACLDIVEPLDPSFEPATETLRIDEARRLEFGDVLEFPGAWADVEFSARITFDAGSALELRLRVPSRESAAGVVFLVGEDPALRTGFLRETPWRCDAAGQLLPALKPAAQRQERSVRVRLQGGTCQAWVDGVEGVLEANAGAFELGRIVLAPLSGAIEVRDVVVRPIAHESRAFGHVRSADPRFAMPPPADVGPSDPWPDLDDRVAWRFSPALRAAPELRSRRTMHGQSLPSATRSSAPIVMCLGGALTARRGDADMPIWPRALERRLESTARIVDLSWKSASLATMRSTLVGLAPSLRPAVIVLALPEIELPICIGEGDETCKAAIASIQQRHESSVRSLVAAARTIDAEVLVFMENEGAEFDDRIAVTEAARQTANAMGASFLDLGRSSTAPGSTKDQEQATVAKVEERIRRALRIGK
ncbi:MAG: hypothetical protein JNL94_19505 [Planctomycetes bacterium]|nr:hypothetical protein [Planctomycetota bacterium]